MIFFNIIWYFEVHSFSLVGGWVREVQDADGKMGKVLTEMGCLE